MTKPFGDKDSRIFSCEQFINVSSSLMQYFIKLHVHIQEFKKCLPVVRKVFHLMWLSVCSLHGYILLVLITATFQHDSP